MAEQSASSVGMTETDRILIIVPMFHANAWGTPYAAWMAGTDMIMPQMFLMGQQLAAVINEHHPTLACGVPTIWNGLLALDTPIDFSTVRGITAGGAAVPQSLIEAFEERFGATIIQGWGMTETSPLAAFGLPPARRHEGHDDMYYKVKAGRVVGGVEVRVVAEDGTVLPNDGKSVGEFEIRGPWVTGSYYKDEDPAKFHDGWLRTGDVGTLDGQGYMTISDRTKDVIKSGGEWISSVELENAVMAHPDVFEAAVIAVPDPKWSERPLVAVVPKPGRSPAPADLVAFLAERVRGGGCPTSGPSSARCPRPASASSTRRSCGPPTPTATTRCEHGAAQVSGPSEAMADGGAARRHARGAVRHGDRCAQPRHLRRPRLGRDGGGPGHGAPHPQGPPSGRELRLRPAGGVGPRPGAARRRRRLNARRVRLFVAVWPDERTRRASCPLELGRARACASSARPAGTSPCASWARSPTIISAPRRRRSWPRRRHWPVECRLGPGTGWFTGVRVLQLPAAASTTWPPPCAPPQCPSCPSPPPAEPPFNGHLTLARAQGTLSVAALGEMARIPFEATFPVGHSTSCRRRPPRRATSIRRWCGRRLRTPVLQRPPP